ncbi:MAG: hypothetical protein JWR60_3564 [Polaromonas sp.]|nr:hypothetical protein [Polaromonas sp.]
MDGEKVFISVSKSQMNHIADRIKLAYASAYVLERIWNQMIDMDGQ